MVLHQLFTFIYGTSCSPLNQCSLLTHTQKNGYFNWFETVTCVVNGLSESCATMISERIHIFTELTQHAKDGKESRPDYNVTN